MVRLIAAALTLTASLLAQAPTREQLAEIFAAYQHANTPGCAVGVEVPGHDTWTAAYGMADLEHGVANTPATVFEAGSVSKQFTAAAVLLLVERGQVSLDDSIRKYFPEIPEYQRPITVKHLLNHTSGLRDWGEIEEIAGWPRTTREYRHANVLDILSRQRSLNYLPGEAWSYTNSGYNLAAMLVERVSGMNLQAFCAKELFIPLGMTSTQWRDDFRRIVPNRAIAYEFNNPQWRQDMPFEDVYGNAGLLTTVADLLKWNRNLASGKLHPEIFKQMQAPGALNNGAAIGYGLGLFLVDLEGLPEVSHSGVTAGYRAWLGRIPSKDFSLAMLCNAGTANTAELAHRIARLYLGLPAPEPPAVPKDVTSGVRFMGAKMTVGNPVYGDGVWEQIEQSVPTNLDAFVGVYSSSEAETTLRVVSENGKLVVHRRPDAAFPLKPTSADSFSCALGSIRFLRDGNGRVVALSVGGPRVWDLRFARDPAGLSPVFQ